LLVAVAAEYSLPAEAVLAGLHGRRSIDTVSAFLPEALRAEAHARIEELEQNDVASIRPMPGSIDLLLALPANWAIVTSCTTELLAARLRAVGLPTAPFAITGDLVTAGKPAPEGYLKGAEALGAAISDCVVVEDAPAGVQAGQAAGAGYVLGVGERALDTDANPVVRDLQGVTWSGMGLQIALESLLRSSS
jgi:sugar-phosphatase